MYDTPASSSPAPPRSTPSVRIARAPGAWPVLGHFLALRRDPLRFLDSLRAHGDLVAIKLGPLRAVVVCDPNLAHQMISDLRTFDRAGVVYDRVRRAMGNGLATSAHADHRRQRLIMQPAFHAKHLPGYADVMRRQTAALMDGWRDGTDVDMAEEMFKLTTSIALRALFSSQITAEDAERLRRAFEVYLSGAYTHVALPFVSSLPLPANRRYAAALRQWRAQVSSLIARYPRAEGDRQDVMARLLAARDEQGEALTDEELSDQVAVLLIAGAETTSAALTWSFYLLCKHPQILEALCDEVDRVVGGEIAGWDHLPELDLTTRVVLEAMRLYPPSWIIPRTATREARLGDHVIPAGTVLIYSQYVLHRHPGFFTEPDRFDPDRWPARARTLNGVERLNGFERRSGHPAVAVRHAYVPFGGGATKCLGDQFATVEAVLALASIAARWKPTLRDPRAPVEPSARMVLALRNLPVRLTARAAVPDRAARSR